MTAYIHEIAAIVESLAIAGDVIPDHNVVLLTLAGLGDDFELLIRNVTLSPHELIR